MGYLQGEEILQNRWDTFLGMKEPKGKEILSLVHKEERLKWSQIWLIWCLKELNKSQVLSFTNLQWPKKLKWTKKFFKKRLSKSNNK